MSEPENEEEICIGATVSGKVYISISQGNCIVDRIITVEEARNVLRLLDSAIDLATRKK